MNWREIQAWLWPYGASKTLRQIVIEGVIYAALVMAVGYGSTLAMMHGVLLEIESRNISVAGVR